MSSSENLSTATATPSDGRAGRKLSFAQYLAYGGGDTANNLAFSLAISFLPLYYTDVALISPSIVATIFLLMRFVDAVTDVLLGSVVDRTNTRWGKFRPYILFGSVPLVVMAIVVFSMPASLHGTTGAIWYAAITYFLMGSVAYTVVNIPYGSLAAAMTDNGYDRSRLALFRSLGSAVMQLTVALAISPAIQAHKGDAAALQSSMTKTIIVLGVVALLLYLFLFIVARENVERSVARVSLKDSLRTLAANRALQALSVISIVYLAGMFMLSGMLVYYTRDVLGNANYMAIFAPVIYGMVIALGWLVPLLVPKLGKPRLFQLSSLVGAAGGLMLWFAPPGGLVVPLVGVMLLGLSQGLVNTLMWNMEADAVEFGEWRTGMRSEGTTYAVFSFVRKMSQALGGSMGLWVIGWFGYVGGVAEQSETALTGIRVAIGLVPAACYLLAAVLVQFYPLSDKKHREILLDLRTRRETGILPDLSKPSS